MENCIYFSDFVDAQNKFNDSLCTYISDAIPIAEQHILKIGYQGKDTLLAICREVCKDLDARQIVGNITSYNLFTRFKDNIPVLLNKTSLECMNDYYKVIHCDAFHLRSFTPFEGYYKFGKVYVHNLTFHPLMTLNPKTLGRFEDLNTLVVVAVNTQNGKEEYYYSAQYIIDDNIHIDVPEPIVADAGPRYISDEIINRSNNIRGYNI